MTGTHTDLYEIRMAASYLRRGMTAPATFSLFARDLPADRGFLIAAGLADCLSFLEDLHFDESELDYLRTTTDLRDEDFDALARLRFTGDVMAVPEGRVVLAEEPLLEITAPLPEAQLVETAMLNSLTFATAVATKAARCRLAAADARLIDFGARRTQGRDAAFIAARASAIAGFTATSHVAAARRYGLTAAGTMAHSYVEAFPSENAAFLAFAQDFPQNTVFLVDTYDTVAGIRAAIDVARHYGIPGDKLGVRLDSGDLRALAQVARTMLDHAGFPQAQIVASGGLDEYALARLTALKAPIDVYGVGTRMGVSADAPSLDTAYKLVEYAGRPVMKLSPGKLTTPGAKQVYRGDVDLLALRTESPREGYEQLLLPAMRAGKRIGPPDTLTAAKKRCGRDLARLPASASRLRDPRPQRVVRSGALRQLTEKLARDTGTTDRDRRNRALP
ncbi:nicotinate phosphoribosyltransferase [Amycolatopsis decaplanina]|uniref:Nicotinate phosphoribosyltransferase n=1 Tax=Amycolatopsis decaplanina DSM 44594 TaxID=1284240 RepID=M2ZDZ2_9PSEU|nr:nicotinate phosphoribosyltransferase [Amycolatopsis decaplanina]EME58579.1 nicotinate phosphoribosyltransferase [Amycolatopsis decaplanina DSM 44594]